MTHGRAPARWVVRRLLLAVPVVAGVTVLTFFLIHLAPGDPIYVLAGDGGSPAYYADMRAKYGLDRPLAEQFVRYVAAVGRADFGYSFMYQAPVAQVLLQHAPASLALGFTSLTLASVLGFLTGLLCAALPSSAFDRAVRVGASIAYAAPVFWSGQVLMLLFALKLGLLPVGGMSDARLELNGLASLGDFARHLVLPATTLALSFLAVITRVSRASVLEASRAPFVLAARARGFGRLRAITRHAAANALTPVIALVGQQATQLVAGAALTEALFGWPGLGFLVLHASLHRDYPLVTAAFIVISSSVVLFNALTDVACAAIDPQVRA